MYCGPNSVNVTDINGTYVNNTVNNTIGKITNGTDFKNTTQVIALILSNPSNLVYGFV
jgi:hypothetical protein